MGGTSGGLASKDCVLVAQHEQFGVLRRLPAQQHRWNGEQLRAEGGCPASNQVNMTLTTLTNNTSGSSPSATPPRPRADLAGLFGLVPQPVQGRITPEQLWAARVRLGQ
jgi:hypothetical protein